MEKWMEQFLGYAKNEHIKKAMESWISEEVDFEQNSPEDMYSDFLSEMIYG
jgi:hypothetical protein